MTWMLVWKLVLVVSLLLFAVLAAVTAVLGARDIRLLFRRLRDAERSAAADDGDRDA